ncbi:MAG: tRNA (adenosine(37)-N6)-threonylcarbamoyltransferase complex dimerization subunit type 1 TsaB [Bacteroidota bacterium]
MNQALILHIETATDICSVAISEGDQQLALAESGPERSHATLLNAFIRECLKNGGKELKQIDAVAVSKGPGSYTGLRIGVSTAKGIAYALEKPLLSSGTLENMAHGADTHPDIRALMSKYEDSLVLCPMLDARRMEVYSAFFTTGIEAIRPVTADIVDPDSFRDILSKHPVCFFGNGSEKCEQVLNHPHAHFVSDINPSASHMIEPVLKRFTAHQFEDVAYFEPFYLKDFIATTPKKKVL